MKKNLFCLFLVVCVLLCNVVPVMAYDANTDFENLENELELMPAVATECNGSSTYMFLGFSGKTYQYEEYRYTVILTAGAMSKSGTPNQYSRDFMYYLATMENVFISLSETQINAWLLIRIMTPVDIAFSMKIPLEPSFFMSLLSTCGVNLGDSLTATALMMAEWYNAEIGAQNSFLNYYG